MNPADRDSIQPSAGNGAHGICGVMDASRPQPPDPKPSPKMIAVSKITFNKEYYAQCFSDWTRSRSKFRKFSVPIAVLIIVFGLLILMRFESHRYSGIAIIGGGIFQLIDALTYRSRWIRKRLGAGGSKAGQFEFHDDRIYIRSDSSEGHFLLSGFIESTAGDHGIFLIPQKGISFYIPWASIDSPKALLEVRSLLLKEKEQDAPSNDGQRPSSNSGFPPRRG